MPHASRRSDATSLETKGDSLISFQPSLNRWSLISGNLLSLRESIFMCLEAFASRDEKLPLPFSLTPNSSTSDVSFYKPLKLQHVAEPSYGSPVAPFLLPFSFHSCNVRLLLTKRSQERAHFQCRTQSRPNTSARELRGTRTVSKPRLPARPE